MQHTAGKALQAMRPLRQRTLAMRVSSSNLLPSSIMSLLKQCGKGAAGENAVAAAHIVMRASLF